MEDHEPYDDFWEICAGCGDDITGMAYARGGSYLCEDCVEDFDAAEGDEDEWECVLCSSGGDLESFISWDAEYLRNSDQAAALAGAEAEYGVFTLCEDCTEELYSELGAAWYRRTQYDSDGAGVI